MGSRLRILSYTIVVISTFALFSCATSRDVRIDATPGKKEKTVGVVTQPEHTSTETVETTEPDEPEMTQKTEAENEAESEVAYYPLPKKGPEFWKSVMTRDVAYEYRAINGISKCTLFMADTLKKHFDNEVYSRIFSDGVKGSNQTFLDWVKNRSLIRLEPDEYSIMEIQELADDGYLVLMAYYFPEIAGHVAFVGHSELDLFTIPAIDWLEGKRGPTLDHTLFPIMVQAGTYTGITSMVYATNGWLRNDHYGDGVVRYYAVKPSAN